MDLPGFLYRNRHDGRRMLKRLSNRVLAGGRDHSHPDDEMPSGGPALEGQQSAQNSQMECKGDLRPNDQDKRNEALIQALEQNTSKQLAAEQECYAADFEKLTADRLDFQKEQLELEEETKELDKILIDMRKYMDNVLLATHKAKKINMLHEKLQKLLDAAVEQPEWNTSRGKNIARLIGEARQREAQLQAARGLREAINYIEQVVLVSQEMPKDYVLTLADLEEVPQLFEAQNDQAQSFARKYSKYLREWQNDLEKEHFKVSVEREALKRRAKKMVDGHQALANAWGSLLAREAKLNELVHEVPVLRRWLKDLLDRIEQEHVCAKQHWILLRGAVPKW
ncbi:uncharacterized protein LOC111244673 [Varroa destructor]|uniref:Uncharacterized protein n=1 Tax=Varroa destructor TaxID=109461 RepID=A0A7M7J7I4_VARDE|nr:uncharacterized protein LOC111244673 [Varroa destructor]XP_022647723.1 uncharacterized protein LOC111244673 [Varroa destructor]